MSFTVVRSDEGIKIADTDDNTIIEPGSWPPRNADKLDTLFDEANISDPQKELFKIILGVANIKDERSDS